MTTRSAQDLRLTLFKLDSRLNWQESTQKTLPDLSLSSSRGGSSIDVWDRQRIKRHGSNLRFTDGWRLAKVWIGPRAHGLAVVPHRSYFEGSSVDSPSSTAERVLVGARSPSRPSVSDQIEGCLDLGRKLGERVEGIELEPIAISSVHTGLLSETQIVGGGGVAQPLTSNPGHLLQAGGFLEVPEDFEIAIVGSQEHLSAAQQCKKEMSSALERCGLEPQIEVLKRDDLLNRLDSQLERPKHLVPLIAVAGSKGDSIPAETRNLLTALDELHHPYRLFSVDNASLRWSALPQLVALLQSAGGTPFRVDLPWPQSKPPPLSLGVDLGHPRARRHSWLALSLVDSTGVHLGSWRSRQPRDETAKEDGLRAGLKWAMAFVKKQGLNPNNGFLVLRDGRLHQGERIETYREVLEAPLTFVELSKRTNPLMFGEGKAIPEAGSACLPEGGTAPFLVPVPALVDGQIPVPLKISMNPDWDELDMGMNRLMRILASLSYAPSLGLKPHKSPAPIYWANGIASIGPLNRQFSGQRYSEQEESMQTQPRCQI